MAGAVTTRDPSTGTPSEPTALLLPPAQVAAAGTAIGNATAIPASAGFVAVTGGNGTAGVQLPAPVPGKVLVLYATVASQNVAVYPPVNGTITNGTANASVALAGQLACVFVGQNAVNWGAGKLS